jgi:hypothetical protein
MTLTSFFHYLLVPPRWHRGMPGVRRRIQRLVSLMPRWHRGIPGEGKGDRISGPGHVIVQNCHRALSFISCDLQKDVKKDVK